MENAIKKLLLANALFKDWKLKLKDFSTAFQDLMCFRVISGASNF